MLVVSFQFTGLLNEAVDSLRKWMVFMKVATQWIGGGRNKLIYTGLKKDLGLTWDAILCGEKIRPKFSEFCKIFEVRGGIYSQGRISLTSLGNFEGRMGTAEFSVHRFISRDLTAWKEGTRRDPRGLARSTWTGPIACSTSDWSSLPELRGKSGSALFQTCRPTSVDADHFRCHHGGQRYH